MTANIQILKVNLWALLLAIVIYSCNTTRFVPDGDKLYTGSTVHTSEKKMDKTTKEVLENSVDPQPNSKMLGVRYKLGIYNLFKEPKKSKGIIHNIKNKFGEAPVLLSHVDTSASRKKMESILFSKGWFRPQVSAAIIEKKETAAVKYTVNQGTRYTINNIFFKPDSSRLSDIIQQSVVKSVLKRGDYVDLETIQQETGRIELYVKEHGYYYFTGDNILFRIDSLHEGKADLYLTFKKTVDTASLQPWSLGEIFVYSNYNFGRDSAIQRQTAKEYRYFWQIDRLQRFKPSVFDNTIFLREDSLYRRSNHSLTIERLMNLNTFRFVRIAFDPINDSSGRSLSTRIYLTPTVKQNMRFESSAYTKSNQFVGSDFSINYRNTNVFKGAEIFDLKITGGFDWQVGGARQLSPNAQTFTATASISVPKIAPRFGIIKPWGRSGTAPRTTYTGAVELLNRPDLYTFRSVRASMGYTWRVKQTMDHNLKLININSISPSKITPKFDSILNDDITLRSGFEKQLIIGSEYRFQYSNTYLTDKKFTYSLAANFYLSGNLASLLVKGSGDTVGSKKILSMPLSQFAKTELELRSYLKLSRKATLAARLNGGVALGYGNSSTVPYTQQFFIGGSGSLRAFRVRTLGPGSYHTAESVYRANESGEIKSEGNIELRYDITSMFKLAGFVDAGNIWLRKDATDKLGSGINNGFLKTMAVGTGIGLRIDASIMIIRLDMGIPIRKPWYPDGNRWVFNEMNLSNKSWRRDNIIANIAIGYPF